MHLKRGLKPALDDRKTIGHILCNPAEEEVPPPA